MICGHLNCFIQDIHFEMENIQMALAFIAQGDYIVTIDLNDAYFSIPIFVQHRKYLSFIWRNKRYEFTCLPLVTALLLEFLLRCSNL